MAYTIACTDCFLDITDNNADTYNSFRLSEVISSYGDSEFIITDDVRDVKIAIADLASVNAGAFANFAALQSFIRAAQVACDALGGTVWGNIIGTLSDQIDLQDALDESRTVINSMTASDTVAASTTSYYQPASAQVDNTTENNRRYYVNKNCVLSRLLVQTGTSQSGTGSCVISINKNGGATGITTTIASSAAAGIFTDYVNSVSLVAGDYITIKVVNNASAPSCAFIQFSMCLGV